MRLLLKFLGLFLSSQLAFGQGNMQNLDHALLWKIDGKGLSKSSYLFGTIHMIPSEDYFLPKGLEDAMNHVQKIFFEIDMAQMNNPGILFGMMDQLLMKNDTSLTDLLTTEEYGKLKNYFDNAGLPLAMFERIKPMFLSAMAGSEGNPFALQDGSSKSYEIELADMAKKKNIPTDGLETMAFQVSIFDSIPYAVQAKMLLESVTAESQSENQMKSMYKSYKEQDLNALNQTISKEDQQFLPYLEMMLYNRNKNWIPIMKTAMTDKPCFFAVGAGHLGGEKGVIQLLRNEGYEVRPVTNEK
jgi:uncharacterized protein YbaP (TraB family)